MAASYSSAVESISDGIMVDQASFGAAPGSLQPPVGYERCDLTLHSVPVYRSPTRAQGTRWEEMPWRSSWPIPGDDV